MSKKIITRFPPSPTGSLHIGNVRTALFNYLFAKHGKGNFIVRIEDTDKIRSKIEYEKSMLDSLEWLGLRKDGELWRQSERTDVYKKYLIKLISDNKAYFSEEVI
ncbi:MAG: glutamate--tRNA ligase family protein, partial [Patescibacteria group bacterium]|nr:glutamate--tRNA ligase family protein [Patescibacteria group bacterium]